MNKAPSAAVWLAVLALLVVLYPVQIDVLPMRTADHPVGPEPALDRRDGSEGPEWELLRKQWTDELHRADPEVDWKDVERRNWAEHLERRNRLIIDGKVEESFDALGGSWAEVGSDNLAGRTHQVVLDEETDSLYVGSNLGGVWAGHFDPSDPDPDDMRWRPISDGVFGYSLRLLRLDGPPEVLLKAGSVSSPADIYRSIDQGRTWSPVSGIDGEIRRMIVIKDDAETTMVLTQRWSRLYRSRDRGSSFELLRDLYPNEGDLWTSRVHHGAVYLLNGNRVEVSTDGGESWSQAGELPIDPTYSIALTGSEAGGPILYAVGTSAADGWVRHLYRSEDAGATWSKMCEVDTFWWDGISFSASSIEPDLVVVGGTEAYRSTDGGITCNSINRWQDYYRNPEAKLHADIPAIDFVPLADGGEVLFISTDGGTYFSLDGGESVRNLSMDGLRVSQYYSILTDGAVVDRIFAGSQDQGIQYGTASTGGFAQLMSGDYGYLTSATGNHDLVYASYPRNRDHNGFVLVAERDPQSGQLHDLEVKIYLPENGGIWLPPIFADPDDPDRFYFCGRFIFRFDRVDPRSWTGVQLEQDFEASVNERVTSLEIARTTPRTWYAGTTRGRILISTDEGETWSPSAYAGFDTPPSSFTVMDILVDPHRPTEVYIAGSGYSNPGVYRSTDGGLLFERLDAGLPDTAVYAIASNFRVSPDLFLAAASGPYRYSPDTGTWQSLLGSTAPFTRYRDVEFLKDRVRFATFGRGIWDFLPDDLPVARASGARHSP